MTLFDLTEIAGSLLDGARVSVTVPAGPAQADATVKLSELGFIVDSQSDGEIHARKTPVIVRGYREGNEQAIRELFRRSFHHELSPELWHWRYRENPLGALRISVAWASDGGLLGHYGGYPVAFRHGDATMRAHQNGDVMTDRRVRRLGHGGSSMVRRMAQHFWAAYGEGRVDFHYGFNTGTARELQKRVVPGVRVLEDVGMWVSDDPAAGAAVAAASATAGWRVERVSRFDDQWDVFAARTTAAYGLCNRRDAAWINWRYASRPGSEDVLIIVRAHGQIAGGAVFQWHPDETRWGDALFDPQQPDAPAVALAYLRSIGAAARVRAWFPTRPDWWVNTLARLGFRQEREPHGLSLVYVPFTTEAERLMPALYYSWGDSDLF
jgi:hypothetical protein